MTQPNENGNAAVIHDLVSAAKNTMRHLIDLRTDLRQSKYQAFQRSPISVVEDAHEAIRLLSVRFTKLTTERNALAEKVKAMEDDAEVGRLVREIVDAGETLTISKSQGAPYIAELQLEAMKFNVNLLKALQALSQGEEA